MHIHHHNFLMTFSLQNTKTKKSKNKKNQKKFRWSDVTPNALRLGGG